MSHAFIGRNPGQSYESNALHFKILSVASHPAFAPVDYTIRDPDQRKPFSMGWIANDGQYMDAGDALKLSQSLKAYLATPAAKQAYADFYENKYRHRSIPYEGEPPDRETLSAEFMARDHRWADFLTNCGGFEIRKTKRERIPLAKAANS